MQLPVDHLFNMNTLVPMAREAFAAFSSRANEAYARDNVRSGRWSSD